MDVYRELGLSEREIEMIAGYQDGYRAEELEPVNDHNWTPAYRHGWLNGRDDRTHNPRAIAAVLRAQAEAILNEPSP